MAKPFERRIPADVLDGPPKAVCTQQIEELLAGAGRISEVSGRDVAEVGARHGLDLARHLRAARRDLYRRFLEHCLVDYNLSREENADLAHLREILHLQDWEAVGVHDEVCRRVYGAALAEVLEDNRLDPQEEEFIRRLREDLEIPLVVAEGMLQQAWREAGTHRASTAGATTEASPSERSPLRLEGSSETSIEDAVRAAVKGASSLVPKVRRVAVDRVEVDVRDGEPIRWHVLVRAPERADDRS